MEETISIKGTLLMLDDATPHVAVPVQVICRGKVINTTLSDAMGRYQFVDLKQERYHRTAAPLLEGQWVVMEL